MIRWMLIFVVILFGSFVQAADTEVDLNTIKIDIKNQARLQRGAKMFMNYCSGCHSLKYLRYSSMAHGLGLTTFDGSIDKNLLMNNLVFTSATMHDPIDIAMPEVDARQWFGRLPPDLTLTGRERGAEWIYTYLKSFYKDKKRPFGANNLLVPDVSMPNILAPLQGEVIAVKKEGNSDSPSNLQLVLIEKGSMTQQQFDSTLIDLVTFMVYVSEPHKLARYSLGVGVIIFLSILTVLAYLLKKLYWRKIK